VLEVFEPQGLVVFESLSWNLVVLRIVSINVSLWGMESTVHEHKSANHTGKEGDIK